MPELPKNGTFLLLGYSGLKWYSASRPAHGYKRRPSSLWRKDCSAMVYEKGRKEIMKEIMKEEA
jgi:hypothetical protein